MRPPAVVKYGFRIRTRQGIVMDVQLPGRDAENAERKLLQIYRECTVIARDPGGRSGVQSDLVEAFSTAAY